MLWEPFEMDHWECYKAVLEISLLVQSFLLQQKLLLDTGDSAGAAEAGREYHHIMEFRQRVSRLRLCPVKLDMKNLILDSPEVEIYINSLKLESLFMRCSYALV